MRKTLIFTVLLFTATLAGAAEVDLAAKAMAGTEANFTHRFTPKGFKTAQTESGTVIFGALPSMRWSYEKPEQKLFVFNGSQSWFYVPGDKQVTTARVTDERKRELPFLLIGDPAARDRYFVVKESKRGNVVTATLQPRQSGIVRAVALTINATNHLIQKIEYYDNEGNHTAFEFSGYHPRAAGAETFTFSAPAGTQVINQ
ncbi:MAG TPA: outer membrane lipoprotein carrier protein LolA [Thermoanaerobaculia bacterium]|nr:outer membrane lipoprotein carrier protein LolA [Thermoanaerobaculia bacterium]